MVVKRSLPSKSEKNPKVILFGRCSRFEFNKKPKLKTEHESSGQGLQVSLLGLAGRIGGSLAEHQIALLARRTAGLHRRSF